MGRDATGEWGQCSGNVLDLLEDVQELKPTIFCSVPRLWNRIYDKVILVSAPHLASPRRLPIRSYLCSTGELVCAFVLSCPSFPLSHTFPCVHRARAFSGRLFVHVWVSRQREG